MKKNLLSGLLPVFEYKSIAKSEGKSEGKSEVKSVEKSLGKSEGKLEIQPKEKSVLGTKETSSVNLNANLKAKSNENSNQNQNLNQNSYENSNQNSKWQLGSNPAAKSKINEAQQKAISHREGPMMVLAGPGSGKTFVITRRIRALIQSGISPENILVITFTKASALEMQQRFQSLMEGEYAPVNFGTFHAIYFHILSRAYHYDFSNIITEKEKRNYMKCVLDSLQEEGMDDSCMEMLLSAISKVKNDGTSPEEYHSPGIQTALFTKIYREYEQMLQQNKKLDFDDMVLLCHKLLMENREELEIWRENYQYILIDEFQDINRMQYEVIRKIASPRNNLFIVGDDDQSIYGFRGSKPEIMLHFPEEYPECRKVILSKNYRSTCNIVDSARSLIENNKARFRKELESVSENGKLLQAREYDNKEMQAEDMVRRMKEMVEKEAWHYKDMAVIIRTNAGARSILPVLTEHKIEYIFKEKAVSIFSHPIAQDILAVLAFVYDKPLRTHLYHFMNRPTRYLPRNLFQSSLINLDEICATFQGKKYLKENLCRLNYDLLKMKNMTPFAAVNYFLRGMGYEQYVHQMVQEKKWQKEDTDEVLSLMKMVVTHIVTYRQLLDYIQEYEDRLEHSSVEEGKENAVTIITMHSSKGLEYPVVFLPDLNDGNVPQKKSDRPEEIEEERRVFYVALTRAKKEIYLSYIKGTKENRLSKSRFLNQIKGLQYISE